MTKRPEELTREEIEELLPWYAAGTLDERVAELVEQTLAADPELARRYELVREELDETIRLNESLGAPSPRAAVRLFERVEREGRRAPISVRAGAAARGWFARLLPDMSPRALAWSSAAGIVIAVQAAFIATFLLTTPIGERTFLTASAPHATVEEGTHVLIGFQAEATAADITGLLREFDAAIVDGPRAGELYRVRVGAADMPVKELDRIVMAMQRRQDIVRMVGPAD